MVTREMRLDENYGYTIKVGCQQRAKYVYAVFKVTKHVGLFHQSLTWKKQNKTNGNNENLHNQLVAHTLQWKPLQIAIVLCQNF